jgi:hypothetical protein
MGQHSANKTPSHSDAKELQQAVISAHMIARSFSLSLSISRQTWITALLTNEYLKVDKSKSGALQRCHLNPHFHKLPIIAAFVQLTRPSALDPAASPGIGEDFLHVLRVVHVVAARRGLQGCVKRLSNFRVGVTERVRYRFQQAARRVEVVEVRQDAAFGRAAISGVADVIDDFAQLDEHGGSLFRRD